MLKYSIDAYIPPKAVDKMLALIVIVILTLSLTDLEIDLATNRP